jgi:hypothetical protein
MFTIALLILYIFITAPLSLAIYEIKLKSGKPYNDKLLLLILISGPVGWFIVGVLEFFGILEEMIKKYNER